MDLQDKVALITGSATGLGKAAVKALAKQGCQVAINYRSSQTEALQLQQELREQGIKAASFQADISRPEEAKALVSAVQEHFGGIDILINNAGPFVRERRLFADYDFEEIQYLINGNLLAVMQLDHLVLAGMRERGWGRIIHFGFAHAGEARGWPHRAAYAAAKVGLVSFTKTLAVEEAANGITINMICPGDIRGINKEKTIQEVIDLPDEETPRGRPGSGEDVCRALLFLCDPLADFVTGNIIDISGGLDPIRTLPLR